MSRQLKKGEFNSSRVEYGYLEKENVRVTLVK